MQIRKNHDSPPENFGWVHDTANEEKGQKKCLTLWVGLLRGADFSTTILEVPVRRLLMNELNQNAKATNRYNL
ncbi:MAG TPA: hypothetical protein PKO06_24210, partial [Candidatus Ozemobacteraceae bacterium]|nr:hypothetical protein [Candidatus Ozemobacteraceae bacterium]